jgi:hypothetical protein
VIQTGKFPAEEKLKPSDVEAEFAPASSTKVCIKMWVQKLLHFPLFSLTISYKNREINDN